MKNNKLKILIILIIVVIVSIGIISRMIYQRKNSLEFIPEDEYAGDEFPENETVENYTEERD